MAAATFHSRTHEVVVRNIEELMRQRHWRRIDLARNAGITPCSVTTMLDGTYRPTLERLETLADAFGVPVSRLFRGG